ncbi:hypothetical protein ORV05_09110 [Amycolatopsis cynarae]|uniref:Uncharacterized protein n=1 Tax=Amycolatopsis cynarae TaxID=2995223 RepID=A0ABY7B6F8_9PSEU|nr:hypothetical protein [Amycolatopsis sp. HUAS 11-8]WAL67909.1 hypothetical protein ORV05_09110 [Amycolatopsis sp. HUAS 11-8]
MLAGNAKECELLFSVLSGAAREWASPLGKSGGEGVPFKVLLLAYEESIGLLLDEVSV